jgi:hypothetical protein
MSFSDFSWLVPVGAATTLLLILARGGALLSNAPTISSRLSPWLRLHPWWPVPAERRAETLLRDMLSQEEYRRLLTSGFLEISSPTRPDRVYRIPRGPGQVLVEEHGRVLERLCLQPEVAGLPEADVVLMHKLLIEADEDRYLATANHFPRSLWRY